MDQLIHLGNILIFASFSVADILWLRLLQIVASAAFIGYFAALDLAAPIAWNVAFIALNLIHSVRLIRARRPAPLTAAQERLYLRVFQSLTRREFLALLGRGEWRDVEVGERLVAQEEPLAELMLVTGGRVAVLVGEDEVARLGPGNFVGEMSFFTKSRPSASVFVTAPGKVVAWPADALRRYLEPQKEMRAKLERIIGADVIDKLRAAHDGLDLTLERSTDGKLRR